MTGPEHYQHAEELLDRNGDCTCEDNCETCAWRAAKAQVHATLALAAATAIQPSEFGGNRPESKAWHAVAAVSES